MTLEDLTNWADALEGVIERTPSPRAIDRVAVVAETGSTQDAAMAMSGGRPGLLVIAGRQTAGRGRLGRAWRDAPGRSLAMTMAIDAARYEIGRVSLAAGVGVCRAAERAGAGGVGLKWPNDVVERPTGRKLAGVLIEGRAGLLLVGVGVNVSHAAEDWPEDVRDRAVSLEQLRADVSRVGAAALVLASFEESLRLDHACLVEAWATRDTLVGSRRRFMVDGRAITGRVQAIDPACHIVVLADNGARITLPARSTTLLPVT